MWNNGFQGNGTTLTNLIIVLPRDPTAVLTCTQTPHGNACNSLIHNCPKQEATKKSSNRWMEKNKTKQKTGTSTQRIKEMSYEAVKRHRGMHIAEWEKPAWKATWFQLYDVLEKAKQWRQWGKNEKGSCQRLGRKGGRDAVGGAHNF